MNKEDTLDAAFPPLPTSLRIGDTDIDITPIRLGDIPQLTALIRPLIALSTPQPQWAALFAEYGDNMLKILSIGSRQSIEWVRELSLEDGFRLAEALFAANVDFFVRRVMPLVQSITQQAGRMSSSASSAADTDTATS